MNVSLTTAIEKWIDEKVKTGRYTGASELLREAVRRMMTEEETQAARLSKLESALDEAHAAIGRGEGIGPEQVKEKMRRWKAEQLKKKKAA